MTNSAQEIKITVKLTSFLRKTAGEKKLDVTMDQQAKLQDLLDQLCEKYGEEFAGYLFDSKGRLKMTCLINGKFSKPDVDLNDNDLVSIIGTAGGG